MLKDDENQEEMKLIDEKPIETRPEDRFGHQYYVDIIKKILNNCPSPYCIGLFGKWGSGKTGIAKILEIELRQESSNAYEIVYFDTWKHSDDTLRRQLLIEIDETVFSRKKNYKDSLYCTHHTQNVTRTKIKWSSFLFTFGVISVLLLLARAMLKPANGVSTIDWYGFIRDLVFPAIVALFVSLERAVEITTDTKSIEKPTSPEEFEFLFKTEVLKDISDSKKKLLIIFDNLDRCDSETVIKTLRGINTFLGEKGCVYIIPCDPEAIRKHLKNQLYKQENETADPDEFLRKVFQISIDIHPLIYSDIRSYAEELINQTSLGNHPKNRQIIHVITQAFVNSPRRIKEMLNNLTIRYFIARKFEIEKRIVSNIITKDIDFLAKIMVLKEQWHDFYDIIQKDGKIYNAVIDHKIENKNLPQMPEGSEKALEILNNDKELRRFIESTKTVQNENIDLFLQFNQDPLEVIIPESKKFKDALIYRKTDDLIQIFESAKDDAQKIESYTKIIEKLLREEDTIESFINIFDLTSKVIDYVPQKIRPCFSEEICSSLDRSYLRKSVHSLDLDCFKVFQNLESSNPNLKTILREFAGGFKKSEIYPDFPETKLSVLFENSRIITEEVRPITSGFFDNRFKDFKTDIIRFLSKYDIETSSKFIEPSFVKNQLEGSITNKPSLENQEVINLYLSLKSIVPLKTRNKFFISKMIEILKNAGQNIYDQPKKFAVENLEKIKFEIPDDELVNSLLSALDSMQSQIEPTEPQPQNFQPVSRIYVALYPAVKDNKKAEIKGKLSHLIKTEPNYYEEILKEIKNSKKVRHYSYIIGFMTKNYIQTGEYEKKSNDEKNNFLKMLYEQYYQQDINEFCEYITFEFLQEEIKPLFNFGLFTANSFADEIVQNKLDKKLIETLIVKIIKFKDEETNYISITEFLNSSLLFSKKSEDKNFIDDIISRLVTDFLRSEGLVKKRVIKDNFPEIKSTLSEDTIKRLIDYIAQNLLENIIAIRYEDPSFEIILENQELVDASTLLSLKNKLKSLKLKEDINNKKKYFYHLPKLLDKNEMRVHLQNTLDDVKDKITHQEVRKLALDSIREMEARVDKNWSEWKEFESIEKAESK